MIDAPTRGRRRDEALSPRGKPFPLHGIRILDFTWFLASAGGTRFLSAFGAESIKVELKSHPDTRLAAMAPVGGRAAREQATAPLPGVTDPDMGGQFNNKNPGKRGISLNVRHPKGLEIARRLVAMSDIVAEGFSPGVLDSWGLGYDALRAIKPDIIYVQQSGMGAQGTYGRFRTVGPDRELVRRPVGDVGTARAGDAGRLGLLVPRLDGRLQLRAGDAHRALPSRAHRAKGSGSTPRSPRSGSSSAARRILDWSANGRIWSRYGNRSPYKPAAPHGVYPCAGDDRWITIACFTEAEWRALTEVAGHPEWADDPRFTDLAARLAHQDALDALRR